MAFVRLSNLPAPSAERICNIPSLAGGLNIHDDPVRLAEDQSPELVNLWWKDGLLRSRPSLTAFTSCLSVWPFEEGISRVPPALMDSTLSLLPPQSETTMPS